MENNFKTRLTEENYLEEIQKYVDKLNELARGKGVENPILILEGSVLGYNNGGKLPDMQKNTGKGFESMDLSEWAEHGPESLAFIVNNVGRYGLISHNLYDHIKVGGKEDDAIMVSAA